MTRRYKSLHTRRTMIATTAIPLGVAVLVVFTPIFSWLLGPSHVLARPFWWLSQSFSSSASNTAELARSKKSLVAELNILNEEMARLQTVDAENRFLKNENTELQTLLGNTPVSKKGTLARVLVRPPQTWYDSLIVDVGISSGVVEGDRVYAYGIIPMGTVVAVAEHTATIELFSASNQTTDAILIPGNIPVQLSGTGNTSYEFKLHRDLAVDESSVVITPQGELLASVRSIQFDTRDPFKTVRAVSDVNIQNLRFVTIVR